MSNKYKSTTLIQETARYFGRPLTSELLEKNDALIRVGLREDRSERKAGKCYERKVWGKHDRASYLREQALRVAEHANQIRRDLLTGLRGINWPCELLNPNGSRFCALGNIHFRFPSFDPEFLNLSSRHERYEKVVEIERIKLHPSLRKQRFLRLLGTSLHAFGFRAMVCNHVYNPSLAYFWMQQSIDRTSGIYVASEHTVDDFVDKLSPGPSFVIDLDRWLPATSINS